MKACSRRWAVGALLTLGGACGLGIGTSTALAKAPVACPQGPMRLSRLLKRSLRGDDTLSVERVWRVAFSPQGQGISISGEQLSASVEAPETLNSLAQIEENRSTGQMWPILLSGDGKILAAGPGASPDDVNQAITLAEELIAGQPIPASQQAAQTSYLRELQRSGASLLESLPQDLFFPDEVPQLSRRTVELPGGLSGEFEVAYVAKRAEGAPWLGHALRKVVTRIGDSERIASEEWSLEGL